MERILIPLPRRIRWGDGTFDLGGRDVCRIASGDGPVSGLALTLGEPPACEAPEGADAYALRITPRGLRLQAGSEAGLFYGLQTLAQLEEGGVLPAVEIDDWADIPIRMLHWDLKGYLPKFDVLCEELRILASCKVNAILLELEDKYDFASAPGVGVAGAYTREQLRELSRLAKSLHIRIVPKLQSIAHVDYILKHAAYRDLRENGHVFQYCPCSEAAQALWEAMAEELMDCFEEHRGYFHIGADEPGNLGECPRCAKLGKAGSYLKKVGACADFVRDRGWTPVLWDDILRNKGGLFDPAEEAPLRQKLGRDAVLMYWAYGYGGKNNEFPYLDTYAGEGLRVWGASGYAGCDNWAGSLPPLAIRGQNLDAWAVAAKDRALECVCATGWTRIGSADCPAEPQESSWFTILYAAQSMWSGPRPYRAFAEDVFRRFYGAAPDGALLDAVLDIARHPCAGDLGQGTERLDFLRVLAAMESLDGRRRRLDNWFQYYDGKLGAELEDYRLAMLRRFTAALKADLAALKARAEAVLPAYYEPVTVRELLQSRFSSLEKRNKELSDLLSRTREM